MDNQMGSLTAIMTAYLRGYHAMNDDPCLVEDSLAFHILPEEARMNLERHLAENIGRARLGESGKEADFATALDAGVRVMAGPIVARSRYVEEGLKEYVSGGVRQYVILGAGMDTFAYRSPDWPSDMKVFEIDHPDTQRAKRWLLGQAGVGAPDKLEYVAVDFEKDDLAAALTSAGYDSKSPAYISWLGVTHYLPEEATGSTLQALAAISAPGTAITFDYWDHLAFDPRVSSDRIKSIIDTTRRLGEPIITGFDPDCLTYFLEDHGWTLLENLGPDDIQKRILQVLNGRYSSSQHVHYARAEVK